MWIVRKASPANEELSSVIQDFSAHVKMAVKPRFGYYDENKTCKSKIYSRDEKQSPSRECKAVTRGSLGHEEVTARERSWKEVREEVAEGMLGLGRLYCRRV